MNASLAFSLKSGAAPLTLALIALASPAFAQTAAPESGQPSPQSQGTENSGSDIVVTGSRIARPQTASSVPIAVVTSQNIEDKGITNIQNEFKDLPIVGQSMDSSSSNFLNSENGVALVNLRNLGSSRTLVLINGRRSVGIPGNSAVDLNNIATDLIDHVEIATGGTSAVYGSDAVAGVVNIILKNKFDGIQLHAQNMLSDKGDAQNRFASLLGGFSFGEGKGHFLANATYSNDEGLSAANRSYSQDDSPNKSSYPPQGVFFAGNDTYTYDANNKLIPFTSAKVNGYNRNPNRLLTVPVERYLGSALGEYEFSPLANLFFEFTYVKTKAHATIEPQALDDGTNPGQGVLNYNGGYIPGISVNNPFVPAAVAASALAAGSNYIDFLRRSNDIFDRSNHNDRDHYRGVIGLKGDLGGSFQYDLSYEHSRTHDHTYSGAVLLTNYGAALNAVAGPNGPVCADPGEAAAGCVPINIFGFNTASPAANNFLSTYNGVGVVIPGATPGQRVLYDFQQRVEQDVATLNLRGSLFRLPGGPFGIAAGAEYHAERSSQLYDPFTLSGYSSAQQASNTVGRYHSKEGYVELSAPLLGGMPFVHDLTLEGAARYSDYSTVGGIWSYKYGGSYAPTPDIRFRAVYARAVRAPNIAELYSAQNLTAITITDPCDQGQGSGALVLATLPTGCAAVPGIANYLKTHTNFVYSLAQVQQAYGYLGGNPNLQAEATNTFTAGVTFTPTFLRRFFLTADYYAIKVKNAVSSVDQQTSATQCFQSGNPQFCNNVFRNTNGFITQVNSFNINAASYLVSGLDIQSRYAFDLHRLAENAQMNFGISYTHKFKQQQTPFAGSPVSNELGTADVYAGSQLGTGFKDQFTIDANLRAGPFSLAYNLKYLGPVTASLGVYKIPAYTYHDLQLKMTTGHNDNYEFYVGANNLFDKQPPFIASGNSQWPGANTVADTYDLLGRMVYAGFKVRM